MIESAAGTRCSQSINSSGPYMDVGVAVHNQNDSRYYGGRADSNDQPGALGYARIVIPLGPQPKRIDCIRLYEMELERLRHEIALMRMGME